MALHIESGNSILDDVKMVEGRSVRFVTEDGRTMFDVSICKDGKGIEVRGIDVTKVDGVLYSSYIDVRPRAANAVEIKVRLYDE